MKIKTPKKENLIDAVAMGSGAVLGVGLGRGVNTLLPSDLEKNTKTAVKVGLALASFVAVGCISSTDIASKTVKASLLGMGAEKTLSAVKDLMEDSSLATEETTEDETGKRFIQSALGLKGAGCESCNSSVMRLPQLRYTSPTRSTIEMQQNRVGSYAPAYS